LKQPPSAGAAGHADDPGRGFIAVTRDLADAAGPEGLTVAEVRDRVDERAFGLMILILTIPCLVPGLPGAQVIAIGIFLLAIQLALGMKEPWLPGWFLRARAQKSWLTGIADFSEKRLAWTERLARPRLTFLASGPGERFAALVMALAAVTIMLPITNTLPSLALALAAIGLLQRDGLFVGAGVCLALAWTAALAGIVWAILAGAGPLYEFALKHAPWLVETLQGARPAS
jgi:hypothetical protein